MSISISISIKTIFGLFLFMNLIFGSAANANILSYDRLIYPDAITSKKTVELKGLTVLRKKCVRKLIAATKNNMSLDFIETDSDCIEYESQNAPRYYGCSPYGSQKKYLYSGDLWGNLQEFPLPFLTTRLKKGNVKQPICDSRRNIIGEKLTPVYTYYSYRLSKFGTGNVNYNSFLPLPSFSFSGGNSSNDQFIYARVEKNIYTNDTDGVLLMYDTLIGKRVYKYVTNTDWVRLYKLTTTNNGGYRTISLDYAPKGKLYAMVVISPDNKNEYRPVDILRQMTLKISSDRVCYVGIGKDFDKDNIYLVRNGSISNSDGSFIKPTIPLDVNVISSTTPSINIKVSNKSDTKVGGLGYNDLVSKDAIKIWRVLDKQSLKDYSNIKPKTFEIAETFDNDAKKLDFNVGVVMDDLKLRSNDFKIILDIDLECK